MKILIACEFSGRVRDAFLEKGHDAWSCDLLPTESLKLDQFGCVRHIQGNVLEIIGREWDLIIAHPPCTYLCNSGVRWLYNKDGSINLDRWDKMEESTVFFLQCLYPQNFYIAPKICVENPIPHKYAIARIGRKYDQIIQPWQFGHGETKATCLWLKDLPPLKPTKIVGGREAKIHIMSPSPDRGKLRSLTYQGIADAMAEQWG